MVELQSKIDKKIVAELPKVSFPGRIFVIYTEAEARKAIDYLNTHVLVGCGHKKHAPSFGRRPSTRWPSLSLSPRHLLPVPPEPPRTAGFPGRVPSERRAQNRPVAERRFRHAAPS